MPCPDAAENSDPYDEERPAWSAGFSRITRDGVSDIYLVVQEETLLGACVFFATDMDAPDTEISSMYLGKTIVLHKTDRVTHIACPSDFFSSTTPGWELKKRLIHIIPRSAGWLPVVRAFVALQLQPHPNQKAIQAAACHAYLDWVRRRARYLRA